MRSAADDGSGDVQCKGNAVALTVRGQPICLRCSVGFPASDFVYDQRLLAEPFGLNADLVRQVAVELGGDIQAAKRAVGVIDRYRIGYDWAGS
jgi:hypothetical protein